MIRNYFAFTRNMRSDKEKKKFFLMIKPFGCITTQLEIMFLNDIIFGIFIYGIKKYGSHFESFYGGFSLDGKLIIFACKHTGII